MNYRKRAWRSISRRKGKSLILFAVLFILGNVIAGAISIYQATENVEKNIKSQLGASVSIQLDFDKLMSESDGQLPDNIPQTTMDKIGASPYVKYYDYSYNAFVNSEKLKMVGASGSGSKTTQMSGGIVQMTNEALDLKGVQYAALLDLKTNKIQLSKGRTFTSEEIEKNAKVALVSTKFAEENSLSVGDTMLVDSPIKAGLSENEEALATKEEAFEIIGLFQPTALETSENKDSGTKQKAELDTGLLNTIYMPNESVKEFLDFSNEELKKLSTGEIMMLNDASATPYYELKSPDLLESFKEEAGALVPTGYKLTASADTYEGIAAPVKSMKKLAGYVLVVAVLATLFIMTLVILLFLRDRKHELGIYLALGEKRWKIMLQILLEVLVIALVAISFSVISGNLLAKNLSASMLETQMTTAAEKSADSLSYMMMDTSSSLSADDVLSQYQVKLTWPFIALFYTTGILTIISACILPLLYILRLNPKKIML